MQEPENLYDVPAAKWEAWDLTQRAMFNATYLEMVLALRDPTNPESLASLTDDQALDTAWTAAWVAAELLSAVPEIALMARASRAINQSEPFCRL